MCHQTVGLIARQLEAAGIPTVSLTSARDITAAANPPRAVFVDYPLGHTSGRVDDHALNRQIVTELLSEKDDACNGSARSKGGENDRSTRPIRAATTPPDVPP